MGGVRQSRGRDVLEQALAFSLYSVGQPQACLWIPMRRARSGGMGNWALCYSPQTPEGSPEGPWPRCWLS